MTLRLDADMQDDLSRYRKIIQDAVPMVPLNDTDLVVMMMREAAEVRGISRNPPPPKKRTRAK